MFMCRVKVYAYLQTTTLLIMLVIMSLITSLIMSLMSFLMCHYDGYY